MAKESKPMDFEFYQQDKFYRIKEQNVAIRHGGVIWFNSEASRAFDLANWSRALLGWNRTERCIALKPVTENVPGSRTVKTLNGCDTCICCRPFFHFSPGLGEPEPKQAYRCPRAEIDQPSGMILIWLGENYPNAEPAPTSQK